MKVIQLDRRYRQYRNGYTHALQFTGWHEVVSPAIKVCREQLGESGTGTIMDTYYPDRRPRWYHWCRRKRVNHGIVLTWDTTNFIGFHREQDLLMVLMALETA